MLGSMANQTATGLYTNAHKSVEMIITISISISAVFLPLMKALLFLYLDFTYPNLVSRQHCSYISHHFSLSGMISFLSSSAPLTKSLVMVSL